MYMTKSCGTSDHMKKKKKSFLQQNRSKSTNSMGDYDMNELGLLLYVTVSSEE